MIVILVYGEGFQPATIVVHAGNGKTQYRLINSPEQHTEPALEIGIREAFQIATKTLYFDQTVVRDGT
jgi:hypothetical protein